MAIRHKERGFTVIELLLSVAIVTMLAGLSLPIYISFQNRNNLDISTQSIADMLRRAQVYSRSVTGDSPWGVEIQPTVATLFKGSSFAGRNTAFDETQPIDNSTTISGLTEVLFTKFTAAPGTTGTITLSATPVDTRTITINAKGMVNY
ncbi:MAG TPA: type II secretion system protein [Candidatus Chromulinivoraceae bacterium]|nr:type II secretion system protein [Candidatus Chromulinivoraceae bacterium]